MQLGDESRKLAAGLRSIQREDAPLVIAGACLVELPPRPRLLRKRKRQRGVEAPDVIPYRRSELSKREREEEAARAPPAQIRCDVRDPEWVPARAVTSVVIRPLERKDVSRLRITNMDDRWDAKKERSAQSMLRERFDLVHQSETISDLVDSDQPREGMFVAGVGMDGIGFCSARPNERAACR